MKTFDFTQARITLDWMSAFGEKFLNQEWRKVEDEAVLKLLNDVVDDYVDYNQETKILTRYNSYVEGLGNLYWCNMLIFIRNDIGYYVPGEWTNEMILNEF